MKSNTPALPILIVDDEAESLDGFELVLNSNGITHIHTCQDPRNVMDSLAKNGASAVLLDLSMPHISGRELLVRILEQSPHIPVIVVTGLNDVETAVECMTSGAFDYMVKPVEPRRLVSGVRRAVELAEERLEYRNFRLKVLADDLEQPEVFKEIITASKKMRSIFQYCETIAPTGKPLLITGESGVGKELIAKAVHQLSGLTGEFVSINVAGLDDQMFSDTLFGHLKGAFTTAEDRRPGLIQKAAGGTLFLDEIGDLSATSQVKLLRVLQEKEYYPVGSDIPIEMNTRIMAATNRDLIALMGRKRFRNDLYYRIQTHHIHLPPLRERKTDLPLLLDHFLEKAAKTLNKSKPSLPSELIGLLNAYSFPGNIREMESLVFDAVSKHKKHVMSLRHFKEYIEKHTPGFRADSLMKNESGTHPFSQIKVLPTLKEAPVHLIKEAMKRTGNNRTAAAMMLGITRSGLNKALKRADIKPQE